MTLLLPQGTAGAAINLSLQMRCRDDTAKEMRFDTEGEEEAERGARASALYHEGVCRK